MKDALLTGMFILCFCNLAKTQFDVQSNIKINNLFVSSTNAFSCDPVNKNHVNELVTDFFSFFFEKIKDAEGVDLFLTDSLLDITSDASYFINEQENLDKDRQVETIFIMGNRMSEYKLMCVINSDDNLNYYIIYWTLIKNKDPLPELEFYK